MTSPDHNDPVAMETYLEALQHNRVSGGFDVKLSPTFGYVSNIESAEHVRRCYEHKMGIKFSTYRQSKDYGKQDIEVDHHKVCWEDSSRLRQGHLVFDHVPYIVIGIKMLDCQYGRDRHVARKKRSLSQPVTENHQGKRKQVTGKKFGCPAQIYLRDILKFPDYAIDCNTVWRRKVMSEKLRKSLSARSKVNGERRIYIKFPEASDHNGHRVNSGPCEIADDNVFNRPDSESITIGGIADMHGPTGVSDRRTGSHSVTEQRDKDLEVDQNTRMNHDFTGQDQGHQISCENAAETVTRQSLDTSRQIVDLLQSNQTSDDTNQTIQYSRQMGDVFQANQTSDDIGQTIQCRSQTGDTPLAAQASEESNRAAQCRILLEKLTEETYSIQDSLILDTLHEQLQNVLQAVEKAKQKSVQIPSSQCCTDTVTPVSQTQTCPSSQCCTDSVTPKSQTPTCSSSQTCTDTLTTMSQMQSSVESLPFTGYKQPGKVFPKRTKRSCTCKERSCRVCSRAKKAEKTENIHDELHSNRSLSSRTIREAQALILDKFPLLHGFEDTTLGHHLLFSAAQGEFGQLMHDGKDHWVFVTSISCPPGTVKYYDCMGRETIPDIIRKQIACIVCSKETQISVEIQPVQLSTDVTDCGLLALAFALSVLHSEDPASVFYDISSMRHHLQECFRESCLRPFPKINKTLKRTVKKVVSVDVFCLCRMPWNVIADESRMKMAQCTMCGEWWHSNCCGIPDAANRRTWKCPRCEDVHSAVTALNSLQSAVFPNEQTGVNAPPS